MTNHGGTRRSRRKGPLRPWFEGGGTLELAGRCGAVAGRHDRSSPEWPGRLPEAITTSTI